MKNMECPVCDNKNISPFATHCLECGTDVVAYPLLEDLEQQCVDALKDKVALEGDISEMKQLRDRDKKDFGKRMNRMYWVLFLFPLMFFWCGKKNIPPAPRGPDPVLLDSIATLHHQNENLLNDLNAAKRKIAELEDKKEIEHVVKNGDTLIELAQKYLGDGNRWPEILESNPSIKNTKRLTPGNTIIISLKK